MNDTTDTHDTELKVIVERAVRPLRTSLSRKRQMREELLAHVTGIYSQELDESGDAQSALERTRQRFGDPRELTRELQRSVSTLSRVYSVFEEIRLEPGKGMLHFVRKVLVGTLVVYVVVYVLMLLLAVVTGKSDDFAFVWRFVVGMAAITVMFSTAFVLFADRICRALYGIGSPRSWRQAILYCLAALAIFPAVVFSAHLMLCGALPGAPYILSACLMAPLAPLLIVLMAPQAAQELRHDEEWARVVIDP